MVDVRASKKVQQHSISFPAGHLAMMTFWFEGDKGTRRERERERERGGDVSLKSHRKQMQSIERVSAEGISRE